MVTGERVACGRGVGASMTHCLAWTCLLGLGLGLGLGLVSPSEFPERECCDPVYPLPAVSASVTPDPPSSVSVSSVTQETHTGKSLFVTPSPITPVTRQSRGGGVYLTWHSAPAYSVFPLYMNLFQVDNLKLNIRVIYTILYYLKVLYNFRSFK